MKKLIAIIISIILISEGTGYLLADTAYTKTSLRKPLDFSRRRFSPVYLCRILAETIGQSMQKTMRRNIEIKQRGALDIGVIYIEFTPQKLLRETMSEKEYNDLMQEIEENKICMDVDTNGNIWVYQERASTYFIITKDGRSYSKTKREFYKATGRLLEPVQAAYPNEITVYDRDGKEVVLTRTVLLSKEQQGNYFIIHPAKNNIKLVSFEYDSIIEKIVNKTSIEELIRLLRALKSKGLKIAITTTNPEVLNWLRDVRVSHPEIDNFIDYCHVDKGGADIGRYVRELGIMPDQIVHISAFHAGIIHKLGFISLQIAEPLQVSVHEVMRKEVDAVMIGIRNIDDIFGLISNWVNIREEIPLETAQATPAHFDPEQILSRYPELESDVGLREIIERIKRDPNDLIALNRLAAELIRRERAKDSIEVCLYLLGIISERKIEPKGHTKEFLDRNEKIVMQHLMNAYLHIDDFEKAIETGRRLIKKYPEYLLGIRTLMIAYIRVAKYDEAIELGEGLIAEFPEHSDAKGILSLAYCQRAEKSLMLGNEYREDYLRALSLDAEKKMLKDRMVYLGIIDRKEEPPEAHRYGDVVSNINTGEEYTLTEGVFKHILSRHSNQRYEIGLGSDFTTLFPEDMDDATIKELIIGAMRYGVNFSRYLPWWDHRMLVWYVKDNDPDLAARTGVSRLEVLIDNKKREIITGYPTMGERILLVNMYGYSIDPKLHIISSGLSDFIWNTNSRNRVQILAGDSETKGLDRAIYNDSIFGNMELIWRECVIRQALWKGRLIGYQEIKDSHGKKGYLEFYRYDIPDEFIAKFSLPNKTIYVCVDYSSRRLIDVVAQEPRIDHETLGRTSQIYGKRIIDVEPIDEEKGKPIMSRDSLKDLVEEPLLEACRILYDRNIETISTSANKGDLARTPLDQDKHYAYITINFATLARKNKNIIYQLGHKYKDIKIRRQRDKKNKKSTITIYIPITKDSTVEEVSRIAIEIASSFEKQRMTGVETWTLGELQEKHRIGRHRLSVEELEQRFGYYFDSQTGLFYPNREIHEKVMEGIDKSTGPIELKASDIEAQRGALLLQDVEFGAGEEEGEPVQTLRQPEGANIIEIQKPPVQDIPKKIKLTGIQIKNLRKRLLSSQEIRNLNISNDELNLLVNAAISNTDIRSVKSHIPYLNRFSDSIIQVVLRTAQDFMKKESEKQERTQRKSIPDSLKGVERTKEDI